jgi:hypothetical protein
MRQWKSASLGAAVLIGLSLGAGAGAAASNDSDPPAGAKKTTVASWWNWFGIKDRATDKKTPPKEKNEPVVDSTTAVAAPKTEPGAGPREQERATLLRRLAVCDELRQIATQKKDDALLRQAEELDERVWTVYTQRVERLPRTK